MNNSEDLIQSSDPDVPVVWPTKWLLHMVHLRSRGGKTWADLENVEKTESEEKMNVRSKAEGEAQAGPQILIFSDVAGQSASHQGPYFRKGGPLGHEGGSLKGRPFRLIEV